MKEQSRVITSLNPKPIILREYIGISTSNPLGPKPCAVKEGDDNESGLVDYLFERLMKKCENLSNSSTLGEAGDVMGVQGLGFGV